MAERLLLLSIAEAGSGGSAVFTFHVQLDGEVIAANQSLSREQSRVGPRDGLALWRAV